MEREAMLNRPLPRSCAKCTKDAITADANGLPLCARHATIFITLKQLVTVDTTPPGNPFATVGR